MSVHITKTYNIGGLIGLRQNAVKNAGETLGFKEMSLFKFPDAYVVMMSFMLGWMA
mgnify:CR=1 FL=1